MWGKNKRATDVTFMRNDEEKEIEKRKKNDNDNRSNSNCIAHQQHSKIAALFRCARPLSPLPVLVYFHYIFNFSYINF